MLAGHLENNTGRMKKAGCVFQAALVYETAFEAGAPITTRMTSVVDCQVDRALDGCLAAARTAS